MERERKQTAFPPLQSPGICALKLRSVPTRFGSTRVAVTAAILTIGFEPSVNWQWHPWPTMIDSVQRNDFHITNTQKQHLKHMITKTRTLSEEALKQIFTEARTHSVWLPEPVSDDLLVQIYNLMKWGPTSANSSPARVVFVKSPEAKAKLLPCMAEGNVEKTKAAPMTAIIAQDMEFYEKLPKLFPCADARSWFAGNKPFIESPPFRNSTLQGAYFIIAAGSACLAC